MKAKGLLPQNHLLGEALEVFFRGNFGVGASYDDDWEGFS